MGEPTNRNVAFMPIGMGVGIAVGTAIGIATDNLALGLGVGVALGAGFGASMMMARNKKDERRSGGDGGTLAPQPLAMAMPVTLQHGGHALPETLGGEVFRPLALALGRQPAPEGGCVAGAAQLTATSTVGAR